VQVVPRGSDEQHRDQREEHPDNDHGASVRSQLDACRKASIMVATPSKGPAVPVPTARETDVVIDAESVARLRLTIGRLARQMRVSATHAGLTPSQMSVLNTVVRQGPLRLAELQSIEAVNPTMLSRIVGKLEDAGLITRVGDPVDRRVVTVAVTPAGRRTQEQVRDDRNKLLTALLRGLPPEQAAAVIAALPALEALSLGLTS
jgi:DNA-binding MarR family transcriptional regulator